MHPGGRNNPCGTKESDRDWCATRQGCIRVAEIIPVEQKSQIEMHPGGRNHPYGTEKQDRDADKFLFV